MQIRTILHPTDFSPSARQALVEAVALALTYDAKLHVLHAMLLHSEDQTAERRQLDTVVADARSCAERWRSGGGDALRVEADLTRSISAFDAIMGEIEQLSPDVVVLGTHGHSGLRKLLIGSVADKLLRHAPCHVLTVREDAQPTPPGGLKQVLVPSDFSEFSRHALKAAQSLVADTGAAITLVHVVQPIPPMYYAGGVSSWFQIDMELEGRVESRLREWAGPSVTTRVAEGSTASAILDTAKDTGANLIVMGTRGLTGLEHVLVGSVTERVCRLAKVPVLVVK